MPLLSSFFPEESPLRSSLASWLSSVYCFGNLLFLGLAQRDAGKVRIYLRGQRCGLTPAVAISSITSFPSPPLDHIYSRHLPPPPAGYTPDSADTRLLPSHRHRHFLVPLHCHSSMGRVCPRFPLVLVFDARRYVRPGRYRGRCLVRASLPGGIFCSWSEDSAPRWRVGTHRHARPVDTGRCWSLGNGSARYTGVHVGSSVPEQSSRLPYNPWPDHPPSGRRRDRDDQAERPGGTFEGVQEERVVGTVSCLGVRRDARESS